MFKIVIVISCFYYLLIVLQKITFFYQLSPKSKQNRVIIRLGQKYFMVIFAVPFIIRQYMSKFRFPSVHSELRTIFFLPLIGGLNFGPFLNVKIIISVYI